MPMEDRVQVARRFQRSIRIDTDLGDPRALQGFVCPPSSLEVLATMARHVRETHHAAFTWTGPYGTGKSSLVIALSALLEGSERQRGAVKAIVGDRAAKSLWEALPPRAKGWTVLPVVGRRSDVATVIGEALVARKLLKPSQARRWTIERVISRLTELAGEDRTKCGGLVLVIDEMGKLLESAVQDGNDIYAFQQLAEAANRSQGRFLVVGVLHQAFDEYAQRLARELRDEWAKVQGRFVDLAINVGSDEQLELLSRAIEQTGRVPKLEAVRTVAAVVRTNRSSKVDPSKVLQSCWPLHPVVACLLGPISRRRFGQNQRSLFGFLNSAEPFGFQDFLRKAANDNIYFPDRLWDYLRANLEPAILSSADGHRWSTAVEAIERCYGRGASPLHLCLLKTIALIDLFRERSGLEATAELLAVSVPNGDTKNVVRALKELAGWSLILFRKHVGAFSVYAGSDFDIDGALTDALSRLRAIDFRELRALAGLQPILAKRHYHETGALRWFDVDLVPVSEVVATAASPRKADGAIGVFLLAIPTENEAKAIAQRLCREAAVGAMGNVVVGLSSQASHVAELSREFLAMTKVQEERPELIGDAVARREVIARVADLRSRLETVLQKMFGTAEWTRNAEDPRGYSQADLNNLASLIADEQFPSSPRVLNELLNRAKPSSNAVAAQKALLKRMVDGEGQSRLGIQGFPAEGGLFDGILLKSQLYRHAGADRWTFAIPRPVDDPCKLSAAWSSALQLITDHKSQTVSMAEIYSCWQAAPFGIKAGLLPVLGLAFVLSHRQKLAFYREGVFQARFTTLEVDYLAMDPTSIHVRVMNLSASSKQLLMGLASVVRNLDNSIPLLHVEPIDVARGLVGIYESLKPWTKRTTRLSANAITVRNLFKQASDPNKFLFDDIPNVASSAEAEATTDGIIERVREGLEELTGAYSQMLTRLSGLMLAELQVPNSSPQALSDLRMRAKNVLHLSGDFRANALVGRLTTFSNTQNDLEGIASLVVNKPPRDWVDADLDRASIDLAELSQEVVRLETFARVKGRPDKRNAMAVFVGIDGRPTPVSGQFTVTDNDRVSIDEVVARVHSILTSSDATPRNVVLAALAEISARYLVAPEPDSIAAVDSGVEEKK